MRFLLLFLLLGSVQAEDPPVVQAEDPPVAQAEDPPVVQTPLGRVRGRWLSSRAGRRYMAFSGIPFAKPPTGQLRFQAPVPAEPWSEVREATEEGPMCIQFLGSPTGVEDCLYLSVFTHNVTKKAPVLVVIHGGGFIQGTGKWTMPTYFMDNDVVVVIINYRLGIFGFLTFETKDLPGNQGLKDQVMALKWVQQNIPSFGGDPDRVTIHGYSAGGASVHYHYVSPLSKGLFQKGYAMSGSGYNPWALCPPGLVRANAEKLMKLLDCPTDPVAAIPCVLEKDALEILKKLPNFWVLGMNPGLAFGPVLEEPGPGAFLLSPVGEWEPSTAPLIVSASSAEGLFYTMDLLPMWKEFSDNFDKTGPAVLHYWASASHPEEVTKKVREYYFPGKTEITVEDFGNLTLLVSDLFFHHGIVEGANKAKGDVYFLYVDYTPKDIIPPGQEKFYEIGTNHCGELALLWDTDFPFVPRVLLKSEKDVKLSEELVKSVVHFMETGAVKNPSNSQEWKTWTAENNKYLHLHENGYTLKSGLLHERLKFWDAVNYNDLTLKHNYIQHSEL